MKNQLTENIFWNLSLRLELFTSFIPIPTFVYFIAVVGAFKTEEDIRAVALSGLICGTYTVVWGLLYRYFKTKYMLRDLEHLKEGKVSSDKRREKIKLNILHYPYKEGRTIIARWILGATTGLILFGLITGQWFPVIPTLSLYLGLLFVLPICYVMYLFTTENVIRSLLLLPEVVHIRVQKENIYYMGYFMRILLAISAVAIAPITIFGYIIYAIKAGHLSFKDPILHIVLLSFQCITSVVVVAFVVARSLKDGLAVTNNALLELGNGNFEVSSGRTSADDFGEQAHLLGVIILKLKNLYTEITDLNLNLENKVEERTKELNASFTEIKKLKIQQDGDYFLTSLLAQPLFINANKSNLVKTEFVIRQKKTFEFHNKKADLGGDICITGNLKLGTIANHSTYTMALNGDAMGKSMQGAGGSLIMGVVMNSIMARSAAKKRILDVSPIKWLTDIYHELNSVFLTFNGSMLFSATVILVNDETGEMFYWNAEHPFTVILRDNKAEFIEGGLELRKLGSESEFEFKVLEYQLNPNDILILGSDGRDDILIRTEDSIREINYNEKLFLKFVEQSEGDLRKLEEILKDSGELTDDLSLLRLGFQENSLSLTRAEAMQAINKAYAQSKELYKKGEIKKALDTLLSVYSPSIHIPKLNRLLGVLSYQNKDYVTTVEVLSKYIKEHPDSDELLYYLSIAFRRIGNYQKSIETGKKLFDQRKDHIGNLINLSDLHRLNSELEQAQYYISEASQLSPENPNVRKLQKLLRGD
ncbi:MAG: SpoIIE family protein phosphatase [Leptospiraceae bacterium]|nr:SpoIIE family protein phosphatase [Leptospiraceae bacterium]